MNLEKNINIFINKKIYLNKKFKIFSFFFAIYSNCCPTYGEFNDKENIN